MTARPTRTIVCPSCGRLTTADAAECLICGRRRPGMWGLTPLLQRVFRSGDVTGAITVACVALYILGLVFDPSAALRPRGPLTVFSPSDRALWALGGTGAMAWSVGHVWTVFTAMYLHGGLLHILFNMLWVRQLGPEIEEIYGSARFFIIYTLAGVTGFVLSSWIGTGFTVGASGSVFGLLGAIVAFGQKRGGTYGAMVLRQYGLFAVILFVFGLLPGTRVDNWAHAGGFLGGFITAFVLSLAEHRSETAFDRLLAAALAVLTVVAFALSLWTAFAG